MRWLKVHLIRYQVYALSFASIKFKKFHFQLLIRQEKKKGNNREEMASLPQSLPLENHRTLEVGSNICSFFSNQFTRNYKVLISFPISDDRSQTRYIRRRECREKYQFCNRRHGSWRSDKFERIQFVYGCQILPYPTYWLLRVARNIKSDIAVKW